MANRSNLRVPSISVVFGTCIAGIALIHRLCLVLVFSIALLHEKNNLYYFIVLSSDNFPAELQQVDDLDDACQAGRI